MTGTLNLYCLDCHQFVTWQKVEFVRADGYPDWRLEVSCGCGPQGDAELLAMAREAYDQALGVELETQRQNLLDAALGRSGNLYFETLAGMGPGRMRPAPCRFS
jgi:hypothetical protein